MLKRLDSISFTIYELRLFLDTHPDNTEASEMLKAYKKKYEVVKAEFENEYGPLTLNGKNSDDWLKDPWPWDN